MQVIKTLKHSHPSFKIGLTLPVLPSGLIPHQMSLNVLNRVKENGLMDYAVNITAMDYDSSFQEKSMSEYAIDAASSTFNRSYSDN